MLTVDFDRLGLQPGDRVLDMGCGAGRHAFEMYRRGADVIAFDMDADELAGVLRALRRDEGGRRGARGRRGRHQAGRRAAAAVRRRRVRPGRRRRGARAHPRRRRGDQGAGPRAPPRRHDGGHGAALAARGHQLEAVRRLPQRRGRPHPDLHRPRADRGKAGVNAGHGCLRGQGLRPRPALAVLVDQVRGRRRQRRPPAREGLPPAAGLGDHEAARLEHADPRRREGARPADRQEHGALLPQAGGTGRRTAA